MFREKYTKELAKHGDISLVMYVSEDDKGEHTQYVTCRCYDPTEPVGQQWSGGDYSSSLENAMESFRHRTGRLTYARLEELATRMKDVLVDEFDFTRYDFGKYGDNDIDMSEREMDSFELPEDEDGEDEDWDWEENEDDD